MLNVTIHNRTIVIKPKMIIMSDKICTRLSHVKNNRLNQHIYVISQISDSLII